MAEATLDIHIEPTGSNFFLFRPYSEAGTSFLAEHAPDDAHWFGTALVVEHRYAETWAQGALDHGLEVA